MTYGPCRNCGGRGCLACAPSRAQFSVIRFPARIKESSLFLQALVDNGLLRESDPGIAYVMRSEVVRRAIEAAIDYGRKNPVVSEQIVIELPSTNRWEHIEVEDHADAVPRGTLQSTGAVPDLDAPKKVDKR